MSSSIATRLVPSSLSNIQADNAAPSISSVATKTDEALIAGVCAGNKECLAHLFRRYARLVHAIGFRILRDDSEADDLVQDVFLFIHRKSHIFDGAKSSARSWIVQMSYHRAIDQHRYLNSRHFYTRIDLEDVDRPNLGRRCDQFSEILESADLQKLFDSLTENQRRTLQLHFFEGYTLDEIAVKLDQTRGNIKNHYFRGLEKIRKQIFGQHRKGA